MKASLATRAIPAGAKELQPTWNSSWGTWVPGGAWIHGSGSGFQTFQPGGHQVQLSEHGAQCNSGLIADPAQETKAGLKSHPAGRHQEAASRTLSLRMVYCTLHQALTRSIQETFVCSHDLMNAETELIGNKKTQTPRILMGYIHLEFPTYVTLIRNTPSETSRPLAGRGSFRRPRGTAGASSRPRRPAPPRTATADPRVSPEPPSPVRTAPAASGSSPPIGEERRRPAPPRGPAPPRPRRKGRALGGRLTAAGFPQSRGPGPEGRWAGSGGGRRRDARGGRGAGALAMAGEAAAGPSRRPLPPPLGRRWAAPGVRGAADLPAGPRRPLAGLSRASPLLFLFLLPSPRLAAASAPRRRLGDWERPRPRPGEAAGSRSPPRLPRPPPSGRGPGRGGPWRACPACLFPGGAGPLHPCCFPALTPARRDLRISTGSQQEAKNLPPFTSSGSRKLYFDTHAVVCLLEEKGFTTQQAEIIVSALVKIMNINMEVVSKNMVTKVHQEITVQQIMSQIAGVKKDMIILEKSEFSTLRTENEKLTLELRQLKQRVMDEILKVRADIKLDFNIEKSRVKELYSLNERKLLETRSEVLAMQAEQLRSLTQTDRKIDTEVAGLKTMLESHKLDNIKYLAGSIFTCLTVALGFYRLWI
ncbi:mitochondrial calcium uniporter regulator 1 [Macrotis lagotis]|uniref:mitochondrial calcium uniporter regulator 1 n=1 Tax=Macrotis lagotis TaxID=92651 RepID=UPI003D683C45